MRPVQACVERALILAEVPSGQRLRVLALLDIDPDEARRERDEALREARRYVTSNRHLAREIRRAESYWTLWRHLPSPPPGIGPLRTALWRAMHAAEIAGLPMPRARQLDRIFAP